MSKRTGINWLGRGVLRRKSARGSARCQLCNGAVRVGDRVYVVHVNYAHQDCVDDIEEARRHDGDLPQSHRARAPIA